MIEAIKNQKGYAALLTAVIVGAAVLLITKSTASVWLNSLDTSLHMNNGSEVAATAVGCAEETLRRFKLDSDFTADEQVLSLGGGNCLINTASTSEEKTIDITAQKDAYYSKLQIGLTMDSGNITINRWEEIE